MQAERRRARLTPAVLAPALLVLALALLELVGDDPRGLACVGSDAPAFACWLAAQ